jgi:GNAT superfamily N-acetyltransferase
VLAHIRRNAQRRIRATFLALFGQLARRRPVAPHWHLALMGVHPGHRRRGYGAQLLKHSIKICDDEGFPAYVEVWNAGSIGFYQRLGFEVLTTVQVGSSPAVTPMLRRPLTDFKNLIPEGRIDLKP